LVALQFEEGLTKDKQERFDIAIIGICSRTPSSLWFNGSRYCPTSALNISETMQVDMVRELTRKRSIHFHSQLQGIEARHYRPVLTFGDLEG
jgi:hypothetical protein